MSHRNSNVIYRFGASSESTHRYSLEPRPTGSQPRGNAAQLAEVLIEVIRAGVVEYDAVAEVLLNRALSEGTAVTLVALGIQTLTAELEAGALADADGNVLPVVDYDVERYARDHVIAYAIRGEH